MDKKNKNFKQKNYLLNTIIKIIKKNVMLFRKTLIKFRLISKGIR